MAGIDLSINFGDTERQSKSVTRAMNDYLKSIGEANDETEDLRIEVAKTTKVMPALKSGLDKTTTAATNFGKAAAQASSRFGGLSGIVGSFIAGAAVRKAVNDFVALDKGLIGVSKTTGIVGKDLQAFEKQVTSLSKEVPVARDQLLSIAQSAGQLGVTGSENILKFTKTVAQLGTASDLAGEEAATTLARMLTVAGESADQVDILGSAIVALGNNMAATESEIARVAMQVGQATAEFGVSSTQAAAFGAALRSIGVQAELGGSAVGRTFRAIREAIDGGGESFKELQALTGMTGEQLKQTFEEDSTKVFQSFVEGLGKVVKGGASASGELEKFGLKGEEILKVIPTIALRNQELGRALGIAAKEQENATALTTEAEAAGLSYAAQLQVLDNRLTDISSTVGKELVPVIVELSDKFASFLEDNKGDITEIAQGMGSLASSTGDLLSKVISGFNELPDTIKTIGLFGSIFFGAKGAALFAGFNVLYDWADTADEAISRVLDGSMSFFDFAFANGEELREMLKGLEDETSRMAAQAQILRSKAARSDYQEQKDYFISEAEKLELKISQISRDRINADALAAISSFERVAKKKVEIEKKSSGVSEIKSLGGEELSKEDKKQSAKDIRSAQTEFARQIRMQQVLIESEYAKKSIESDTRVFLSKQLLLKQEYEKLKTQVKDKEALDLWYKQRSEEIQNEFNAAKNKANAESAKKEEEIKKAALKKAKELDGRALEERKETLEKEYKAVLALSEDKEKVQKEYAKKFKKIEEEIRRNSLSEWEKWGEDITKNVFSSVAEEAKDTMSDVLFDGIRGDMKDFEDYWDTAWQGILRTFTDAIAEMATKKIVGTAVDFAFDAIFAKDGLWEVEEDGQKVVAHKDEMVVPANIAGKLRDLSHGQDFSALDKALGENPESVYNGSVTKTPGSSAVRGLNDLSPFARGALGDLAGSGIKKAGSGAIGYFSGDMDMNGVINSYFGPQAFLSMFSNAASAGFKTTLGIDSYASKIGGFASMSPVLLGLAATGPLGILAGAGANLLGSAAFDGIMDAADARPYETMKDALEDPTTGLGYFRGRQVGSGALSGDLDLFSLSSNEYTALKASLEKQKEVTGLDRYEPGSFLGTIDSVFTAVGDFIDKINPFNYIAEWLGFTAKKELTARELYDGLVAVGAPREDPASVVAPAFNLTAFLGAGRGSLSEALGSSYRGAPSWTSTGTGGSWTSFASPSGGSSGSSYSGGSFGGGRGGTDIGLADGGMVSAVLAANPRDDGYVPMQMGEYVIKRSSAQSIGEETLDAINQTGSIPGSGSSQVVINFVTSSGQQMKQFVVDTIKDASERQVAVVHADGIYTL